MAQLLTQRFCLNIFFEALFFFTKISFSLQKEEDIKSKKIVAQLFTQQWAKCGPVIDPTVYIYMRVMARSSSRCRKGCCQG